MDSENIDSIMVFRRLSRHMGKYHLPIPTGDHVVGVSDLMTRGKEDILIRFYYPTTKTSDTKVNICSSWIVSFVCKFLVSSRMSSTRNMTSG